VSWAAFRAVVGVTWRERLLRPLFGVLLLGLLGSYVMMAGGMQDLNDPVLILVLLIGGGAIGKEVTSGVLPLIFTRPLVRGHYVLTKWFALASAIAILSTATLLAQAAWLAQRGAGLPGAEVAAAVFTSVTSAIGMTAVLLPLSVLASGYSDVLFWIGIGLVPTLGRKYIPQRVAEEWQMFLHPSLDWGALFGAAPVGWFRLFSYLSTVTLCLCLAVLAANRKELSYASG
jgi:ABC-type transport system involved in multi-copper enzyme maturation permease subunit